MVKNGNIIAKNFLEPQYFRDFSCTGADCPENCCFGWGRIDFTPEEVAKIKSADCSAELKELINKMFVPISETNVSGGDEPTSKYTIKFAENGYCPLQNEKGLCRVQLELGVDYMSKTCMVYPRHYERIGNNILCYCKLSCYHVLDILLNDGGCMTLMNTSYARNIRNLKEFPADLVKKHHELKYHEELFMFFYRLFAAAPCSAETAVIMGLPVAERLSELAEKRLYGRIPDILKAFWEETEERFQTAKAYKSDYEFKLNFMLELYKKIMGNTKVFDNIMTDGKIDISKYEEGERRFEEAFAGRPFAFKNIALNMVMERSLPLGNIDEYNIYENYCYFAVVFSLIRTVAPAVYMGDFDPSQYERQLKGLMPYMGRFLLQSNSTVKFLINMLKDKNCIDKEHIAALLK